MDRPQISVQLLGGFKLQYQGGEIASLARKPVSVLAYLIMNRDRPQTRDLLAGRFWSDLAEDKARKRLSNALWQIRVALRDLDLEDLVEATTTTVQVSRHWPIEVDVEEFERRLDDVEREMSHGQVRARVAENLTELITDYPGDLLAGYYDDWIELDRTRVKERHSRALLQIIKLHKGRSDYVTALRYARDLVSHDPLAEESHREVMRLCALLGQSAAADRQYQVCCRLLEDELGVEPSWETTELMERIRAESSASTAPLAALDGLDTPMVGRARERASLLSRVDDLMAGSGGLILIEGEPGIGKSRLVEDLIDSAEWRGARILAAGHTEVSRLRAYQGLQAALAPATAGLRGEHLAEVIEQVWLEHAAQIFPELRRYTSGPKALLALRPEEELSRTNEALARVLLAQGSLGPTLLVLEDVHWCDDDSIHVLTNLGQRLSRSGVLICLSYRRFEAEQTNTIWSGISALEAAPGTTRVVLGALNRTEIRQLVSDEVGPGALPSRVLEHLVEESGGNPLYLLEALQDPDSLLNADLSAEPHAEGGHFPVRVARALQHRLDALPADVLTVMQAMAALAEPCASQMVSEIAGLDRRRTLAGLTEAVSRGFLVEVGAGVCRFGHDQTRRAVYHAMEPGEILGWHDQIFEVLVSATDPATEQVAYHADLAHRWDEAVRWHTDAAVAAYALNAFGVAAEHYRQADEAAGNGQIPDLGRIDELLRYEKVLDILGRREEQQSLLKRLENLDLPFASRIELAERQAWLLGYTDRHDEAAALATLWADRATDAGYPNHQLLTALGVVRYWHGSLYESIDALREALKTVDEPSSEVAIKNYLGRALIDLSEFDEGNALLAEALAAAEELGDVRSQVEALIHQSASAFRRGEPAEATSAMEASLELSRRIGYRHAEGVSLANLATTRASQGRAGHALPLFTEASEVFDSLSNSRMKAIVWFNLGEVLHSFLGANDEAASYFNSAAEYFRSVGDRRFEMLAIAKLSGIDWQSGRRRLARRRLQSLIEQSKGAGDARVELEARRIAAECASSVGEHEDAIDHLDRALLLIEEQALALVLPHALAHRALAALEAGRHEEAQRFAERAAPANGPESDFGLITAWRCGTVFRRLGHLDDAVAQFTLSYQLLDSNLDGLDLEKASAARSLPRFAAIIEDYERYEERTTEVELPSITAPTGRPLVASDYVTVQWTVSNPVDWEVDSAGERRRNRVERLCDEAVQQGGLARVHDLSSALAVSERTIKRDLAELRASGRQPKTRRSS